MFISVKDAMELTGLSSTTVYRLCNKRINTLYVRKEDNKFLIDKDFLLATYPPDIVKITEPIEHEPVIQMIQPENKTASTENTLKNTSVILNVENDEIIENKEEPELSHTTEDLETEIPQHIIHFQTPDVQLNVIGDEEGQAVMNKTAESETGALIKFSWETVIGISVSLVMAGILIYLIYREIS